MAHAERWSAGVLLAFALAVLYGASRMPLGGLADPGPGFFPFWGAALLALLSLALLFSPTMQAAGERPAPSFTAAVRLISALCLYALLFESVGYVLATTGLLAAILRENRQPPAIMLAVAGGFPIATYYLFARTLGVPLPAGFLPL